MKRRPPIDFSVVYGSLALLVPIVSDACKGKHREEQDQQEDSPAGPCRHDPHFLILPAICHDERVLQGEDRNESVD